MSFQHMPRWYQRAFGALWVVSAVTMVAVFVADPFGSALAPVPAFFTAMIGVGITDAICRALADDDADADRAGQTRLTDGRWSE